MKPSFSFIQKNHLPYNQLYRLSRAKAKYRDNSLPVPTLKPLVSLPQASPRVPSGLYVFVFENLLFSLKESLFSFVYSSRVFYLHYLTYLYSITKKARKRDSIFSLFSIFCMFFLFYAFANLEKFV